MTTHHHEHLTDDEVIEYQARLAAETTYRHWKSFLDGFQGSQMLKNIREDMRRAWEREHRPHQA